MACPLLVLLYMLSDIHNILLKCLQYKHNIIIKHPKNKS